MRKRSVMTEVVMPEADVRQQPGSATAEKPLMLTTDGSRCVNMRSAESGGIEAMAAPSILGQCNNRPVFADVRRETLHIFTLDDSGRLRVELSVTPEGTVIHKEEVAGIMAPGECQGVRAGDFIVFSDSTGELHYMEWNSRSGTYTWLGGTPAMPEMKVRAIDVNGRQATIESVVFPKAVTDLREGVPDEVKSMVQESVITTLREARELSRLTGHWTMPVLVRLAVRMWDGTLLHLTSPRLVAPCSFVSPRRVTLPVVTGSAGATGTTVQRVTLPEYQLEVSVDCTTLARWGNVATQIEVWVSREPKLTIDNEGTTGYSHTSRTLTVTPGWSGEEEMTRRMLGEDWLCVATLPYEEGKIVSRIVNPVETEDMVMDIDTAVSSGITHAKAIASHGGFLHLAGHRHGYQSPMLPEGESDATETAHATVTVTIRTAGGDITVMSQGEVTVDDGVILPLMWYNDRRAVKMRISLEYDDGRKYEDEWIMSPAIRGDASYVAIETTEALALREVDSITAPAAEAEGETEEGTLLTMMRGNPFVIQSKTVHAGGCISCIQAQQSGGGAYTRQYLYLFTDTGIVAVTHDMAGRHTNCRPLSRQTVASHHRVAAADHAVWALSDTGSLLRLRDAKVETMMRGLSTDYTTGVCETPGELWLVPEVNSALTHSVMMEVAAGGPLTVSQSTWRPYSLLCGGSRLFGVTSRTFGNMKRWEISEMTLPKRNAVRMDSEWLSGAIETDRGGVVNINIDIRGTNPSAIIEVRGISPGSYPDESSVDEDTLLWSGRLMRSNGGMLTIPLMLPDLTMLGVSVLRLRLRVTGQFEQIVSYGLSYSEI